MNRKVLIFAMASDKKEAIRLFANKMGAAVVEVLPREYQQQIGYLAGITGFKRAAGKYKGSAFCQEMMVLCGMDQAYVEEFLKSYKEEGISRVDYKAVITPYNAAWTPLELYTELAREHEEMHREQQQ